MDETHNPPRENLVRALGEAPELVRDGNSDGMPVLRGHFSVWDTWTEINSVFEGRFMERFAPTSMNKTMAESKDQMRVLFQHGKDPQIGDKPLGPISRLEADSTGAYYEVPMLDTQYNRELLPGLEAGLYGASHRFQVISEEFVKKPPKSDHNPLGLPERTVTEARVREFGPVTFGAYPTATAGVRSMTDEFVFGRYVDDPERLAALLEFEKQNRQRVTITYGNQIGEYTVTPTTTSNTTAAEFVVAQRDDMEPEPPEATTPPAETQAEPEPSAATTRAEPGEQRKPRFNTREEWLEWIAKI